MTGLEIARARRPRRAGLRCSRSGRSDRATRSHLAAPSCPSSSIMALRRSRRGAASQLQRGLDRLGHGRRGAQRIERDARAPAAAQRVWRAYQGRGAAFSRRPSSPRSIPVTMRRRFAAPARRPAGGAQSEIRTVPSEASTRRPLENTRGQCRAGPRRAEQCDDPGPVVPQLPLEGPPDQAEGCGRRSRPPAADSRARIGSASYRPPALATRGKLVRTRESGSLAAIWTSLRAGSGSSAGRRPGGGRSSAGPPRRGVPGTPGRSSRRARR